jgi:hypothetical protein
MSKMSSELSTKYQQKTDKQHILDNPDTYIGSVEEIDSNVWVLNEEGNKIIEKNKYNQFTNKKQLIIIACHIYNEDK